MTPFLKAPQVGLEPTTLRLTAACSAIELLRNDAEGILPKERAVSIGNGRELLADGF